MENTELNLEIIADRKKSTNTWLKLSVMILPTNNNLNVALLMTKSGKTTKLEKVI